MHLKVETDKGGTYVMEGRVQTTCTEQYMDGWTEKLCLLCFLRLLHGVYRAIVIGF